MKRIFVTSDLHFNHDRVFVWGDRGFYNITEMNNAIVDRWNSVVGKDDTVYVLGDLMLGGPDAMDKGIDLIKRLNGHIRVVLGNHDTDTRIAAYKSIENIESVSWAEMIKYRGRRFFLTHFPSETATLESNPASCVINLHGHTHAKEKFNHGRPYQYNCCLDAHDTYPVCLDDIITDIEADVKECLSQL